MEEQYEETERIHESITSVKHDLAKAVSLLDIRPTSIYDPTSYLDFGIFIALYYLYIHFIERALTYETKLSKKEERCIIRDNWQKFKTITKVNFDEKVASTLDLLMPF